MEREPETAIVGPAGNGLAAPRNVVVEPAVINWDEQGVRGKVRELLADYEGMDADAVEAMDYSMRKTCRKSLNEIDKELNDARKAVKREYLKPLEEFEAAIKDICTDITAKSELLDRSIKATDAKRKNARKTRLMEHYAEFAPALAECIDYSAFASDKWLNQSTSEKKAEQLLEAEVSRIAKDWDELQRQDLFARDATLAHFCQNPDLAEAQANDRNMRQRAERIKEAERQRGEWKKRQEAAQPQPEKEPEQIRFEQMDEYTLTFRATESQFQALRLAVANVGIETLGCKVRRMK